MDNGNKLTWGKTKEIKKNWPFLNQLLQYPQRTPELDCQELELAVANRNDVQECGTQDLSANIGIRSQADVENEGVQHIAREPTYLEEQAEIYVTSGGADRRESVHEICENGVHTPDVTCEDELPSCGSESDLNSTQITELEILNSNQVDKLNVYRARMAQLQDQLRVSKSGRIGEVEDQEHMVAEMNTSRIKPVISPMSFSVKKASTDAIEIASRWRREVESAKLHTATLQTTEDDEHMEKTPLLDEEMRNRAIKSINRINELSTAEQKLFKINLRRYMKAKEARLAAGLDIVESQDAHLLEYHSREDSSEEMNQESQEKTLESNEIEPLEPDERVHTPVDTGEDELTNCGSESDLSTQITELEILNSNQVDKLNVYRARMAQLQDQLRVSKSGRIGEVEDQEHMVAEMNTSRIKPVISPMSFSVKKASTDAIEIASRWRREEESAKLHTAPLQTTEDDEHMEKTRLLDEEMRKWAITSINLSNELSATKQKLFKIRLRRHMKANEARVAAGLDIVESEDAHLLECHSREDSSEEIDQELEEKTLESNEIELLEPDEHGIRFNTNLILDESDSTDDDFTLSNQTPMLSSTDITPWRAEDKNRVIVLTVTDTTVADSGSRDEEDSRQNTVTNESRFTESTAMSNATEILTESLLDFHDATKMAPQPSSSPEVCDTEATFDQLNVKREEENVNQRTDDHAPKIEFVQDVINISVEMSNQFDRELNENIECDLPNISQLSKPNVYKRPEKTLDDKILAYDPVSLTSDEDGSLSIDGEFDGVTAATYYHSHSREATLHEMCPRCSLTSKLPCAHVVFENNTQEVVEACFDDKEKFVQELTNDLNEQLKSMMVYNGLLISTNSQSADWEPVAGLPVFQSEHDLARKEAKDFESEMKLHKFNDTNEGDRVTMNLEEYENADKDESDAQGLEQVSTGQVLQELAGLSQNITNSDVAAEQFLRDKLQNTLNCISDSIDQEPRESLKAVDSHTSMSSDDSGNLEYISAEEDIEENCVTDDKKKHVIIDQEETQQTLLKIGKMMQKQIEIQSPDSLTNLKSEVHQLKDELAQIQHYLDERDQMYLVSRTSQMCRSTPLTVLQSEYASEPPSKYFYSGDNISSSNPQTSYKPSSTALQPQSATPSPVLQPQSTTPLPFLQPQSTTPLPVLQPQSATPLPVLQPQSTTPLPVLQLQSGIPLPVLQPQSATPLPVLQLQSGTPSTVLQSGYPQPYNAFHPETTPHFDVNVIGRVTTDSILIGWDLPYDGAVKSFRIYIDQEPKLSIHSGSRSTAVIHQVNLSVFFAISVHAIGLQGLCIAIGNTDYAPYPVKRNNL